MNASPEKMPRSSFGRSRRRFLKATAGFSINAASYALDRAVKPQRERQDLILDCMEMIRRWFGATDALKDELVASIASTVAETVAVRLGASAIHSHVQIPILPENDDNPWENIGEQGGEQNLFVSSTFVAPLWEEALYRGIPRSMLSIAQLVGVLPKELMGIISASSGGLISIIFGLMHKYEYAEDTENDGKNYLFRRKRSNLPIFPIVTGAHFWRLSGAKSIAHSVLAHSVSNAAAEMGNLLRPSSNEE